MKSTLTKILLGAGVAAVLGACASFGDAKSNTFANLEQIHPGLTSVEVLAIAGTPDSKGTDRLTHEAQWTYGFADEWGYRSELSVDFDKATGLVADTSTLRFSDY